MTQLVQAQLGDLIELEYGWSLPKRSRDGGGSVPVFGSNGVAGFHSESRVEGPGIIVGRKGSAGRVTWCNEDFWPIDTTYYVVLRDEPDLDRKWVYYQLLALRLEEYRTVTGVPGLNRNDVYGLPVSVPPISEQRDVVDLLDRADELRRISSEASVMAERLLPAIFAKMFGDPVANPMGWPTRKVSELATVTTGNTPSRKRPEFFGDGIEWIKSDNINTPSLILTDAEEHLSELGMEVARVVPSGSTLVTCIAGSPNVIGNAALADRRVAFNQQINAATANDDVDPIFLFVHFLVGKPLIQAASTGGMKGLVSKSRFSAVEFLSPPSDLQQEFGRICEPILELNRARLRQTEQLEGLFTAILHRRIQGADTRAEIAQSREATP